MAIFFFFLKKFVLSRYVHNQVMTLWRKMRVARLLEIQWSRRQKIKAIKNIVEHVSNSNFEKSLLNIVSIALCV